MSIQSPLNNQYMYDQRVLEHFHGKSTLSSVSGFSTALGREVKAVIIGASTPEAKKVGDLAFQALKTHYETAMQNVGSELEGLYLTHHYLDATKQLREYLQTSAPPPGWFATAGKAAGAAFSLAKWAVGKGGGEQDAVKKFEAQTKETFNESLANVKRGLVLTPKTALSTGEKAAVRKFVTHLEVAHQENIGLVSNVTDKIVGGLAGFLNPSTLTGTASCQELVQANKGALGQILGKIGESYRKDLGKNLELAFMRNPNNQNYLANDLTNSVTKLLNTLNGSRSGLGIDANVVFEKVCKGESPQAAQERLMNSIADNLAKILVPKDQNKENITPTASPKSEKRNLLQEMGNAVKRVAHHVNEAKDTVKQESYRTLLEKVGAPKLVALVSETLTEKLSEYLPVSLSDSTKKVVIPLLVASMLAEVTESLSFYVNNPQASQEEIALPNRNQHVGNLVSSWVGWVAMSGSGK